MKYKKIKVKVKPKQKEQQTIKLDDEQVKSIIDEITELTEWSTNKIVDESHPIMNNIECKNHSAKDSFSVIIRIVLALVFWIFGIFIFNSVVQNWSDYWIGGINNFATIVLLIIPVICLFLGIDVIKEKDKNYLISLFSALVSLTALIVAIVK